MVTTLLPTATSLIADGPISSVLSIVGVVILLVVLFAKEVAGARLESRRSRPGLRLLLGIYNAPILALLAVFIVVTIVRIWQAL